VGGQAWPARALTAGPGPAYHVAMKHIPEAHQSVVPDRTVAIILAAIVVLMAIIWFVVAWAE
jgi:hypothetical protein